MCFDNEPILPRFNIRATDNGETTILSSTTEVTIKFIKTNSPWPPRFLKDTYEFKAPENMAIGTCAFQVLFLNVNNYFLKNKQKVMR